jgi:hypothetical protein
MDRRPDRGCSLDRSIIFPVLISLGPVLSRRFCSLETGLPSTTILVNIVQFNLFLSQNLTVLGGLGLILEGYIRGTKSLVQTGLNHKDQSLCSLFQSSVLSSLVFSSLFRSWSSPVSVFFQSWTLGTGLPRTTYHGPSANPKWWLRKKQV